MVAIVNTQYGINTNNTCTIYEITGLNLLPKYIPQIIQDINPILERVGSILFPEKIGSFQLSEIILRTFDDITKLLTQLLYAKKETTMNKERTTVKAIKEQLISYFNTIKQELLKVNIPERPELLGLLAEIIDILGDMRQGFCFSGHEQAGNALC